MHRTQFVCRQLILKHWVVNAHFDASASGALHVASSAVKAILKVHSTLSTLVARHSGSARQLNEIDTKWLSFGSMVVEPLGSEVTPPPHAQHASFHSWIRKSAHCRVHASRSPRWRRHPHRSHHSSRRRRTPGSRGHLRPSSRWACCCTHATVVQCGYAMAITNIISTTTSMYTTGNKFVDDTTR